VSGLRGALARVGALRPEKKLVVPHGEQSVCI